MYKVKRFSKEDDEEFLQIIKDRQNISKKIGYAALPLVGGWIGHGLANKNKVLGTAIGAAGGLAGAALGDKVGKKEVELESKFYKNSSEKAKKIMRNVDRYNSYSNPATVLIDHTAIKNRKRKNVQS